MSIPILRSLSACRFALLAACVAIIAAAPAAHAQPSRRPSSGVAGSAFVPGSGACIDYAGDDFEELDWEFIHRHPKSSREQDENVRSPMGLSKNNRWHEGPERGQPDQLEVISTPPMGLFGSQRALLLRTVNSGIPGRRSNTVQQDDLIANCLGRLRGDIPVRERPSCMARVYLPPVDQWEKRSGPQFGYRASLSTVTTKRTTGFLSSGSSSEVEPYWPGMWIHFRAGGTKDAKAGTAYIAVRSDRMGRDFPAREIDGFGWWTLGMSFSPDGMVHYYASPGVEDLTAEDYLTSQYPYGFQARDFRTYFFDVCNQDNGRSWSTPFVIDDPKLYVVDARRVTEIVQRQEQQETRNAQRVQQTQQRQSAPRQSTGSRSAAGNSRRR